MADRAESFRVALRYLGNQSVVLKKEGWTYHFDEREFDMQDETQIPALIDYLRGRRASFPVSATLTMSYDIMAADSPSHIPLPQSMPSIPLDLHWMAETLIAAESLSKFPDLVLKLAYLVLERLETATPDENRLARNFVSHTVCNNEQVIAFIESQLLSARVAEGVQFRRNDREHMAFVERYAYPALERAKELLAGKVEREGGSLGS